MTLKKRARPFLSPIQKSIHPLTPTGLLIQGLLVWLSSAQTRRKTCPSQTAIITALLGTHCTTVTIMCDKEAHKAALNNQRKKVTHQSSSWKGRYRNHNYTQFCSRTCGGEKITLMCFGVLCLFSTNYLLDFFLVWCPTTAVWFHRKWAWLMWRDRNVTPNFPQVEFGSGFQSNVEL